MIDKVALTYLITIMVLIAFIAFYYIKGEIKVSVTKNIPSDLGNNPATVKKLEFIPHCDWKEGFYGQWTSLCKNYSNPQIVFTDKFLEESFLFCPYCGKKIRKHHYYSELIIEGNNHGK